MSRVCRFSAVCLAMLASVLTLSSVAATSAHAEDFSGTVKTVPATGAKPLITTTVDDSKLGTIAGRATLALEAAGAKDTGRAPAEMTMHMQLLLRRSGEQRQALTMLNQQTRDPKNAMFGKTLTPAQFAQTFGLASSDLSTLTGWLSSKGMSVISVDNGRLAITFEGTVAQVEAAFGTEIHSFQGADGAQHYGNATDAQMPRAFLSVVGTIQGLHNFSVLHSKGFDGPVTDFVSGTAGEEAPTGSAPKSAVAAKFDGEGLHDASFTASSYALLKGGSAQLNVRIGGNTHPATGSLQIVDQNGKNVAYVADVTTCEPYNSGYGRSCNVTFSPAATGEYNLTAIYSGDGNERGVAQSIHANVTGSQATYLTVSTSPTAFDKTAGSGAAASGTITLVISWAATGTAPTGTISVFENVDNRSLGTATLPVAPSTTSSGSSTPYVGTSSYSCTTTAANQITTCTITDSEIYYQEPFPYILTNDVEASYAGDANYASSVNVALVYADYGKNGTGAPIGDVGSVTSTTTLTAATYGASQAESATVNIVYNPTYSGFYIFGNALSQYVQAVGSGALGSMGNYTDTTYSCAPTNSTACSVTVPFTVPAVVTPGSYTVAYQYSGGLYWAGTGNSYYGLYGPTTSTTYSLTVNKQLPTFSNMSFSPASAIQGDAVAVTISNLLNYTGVGAAPTGAVTYVLNGVSYTATCTQATLSLACSATVPASTIGALTSGNYPVTAAYAGDTNYSTVAAITGGTFVVGSLSTGLTLTPSTEVYGSGNSSGFSGTVVLTDTLTVLASGAAPTGTVTFTNGSGVTTIATVSLSKCTETTGATYNTYACSYNWFVPAGASGDNAGTYTVTAAYSGGNGYSAQNATGTLVLSKDSTTTTVSASTPTVNSTTTTDTFTTVTTWASPGYGVSPTGTVSLSCPASSPGPCTGLPSMNVSACTVSASARTITCSFPSVAVYNDTGFYGLYDFTATYSGDVNYSTSNAYTPVEVTRGTTSTTTPSVSSGSPVGYGTGGPVVFSIVVKGVNGDGAPSGTLTLTNPTLGTLGTITLATCTATNSYTYTCSYSYTVPAATAAGNYTVTATYGGCGNLCYYNSSSGTTSFTVSSPQIVFTSVSHNMGDVTVGTSTPVGTYSLKLTNNASSAFAFGGITLTGSSEITSATNCPASVASGASCEIAFTFSPTTTGTVSATWSVSGPSGTTYSPSNGGTITGTGIAAAGGLTLTTAGHNWGNVTVGATSPAYGVVMTNTTSSSVALTLGSVTSPFVELTNCPATLAAGASCNFQFTATPTATGTVQQVFSIAGSGVTVTSGGNTVTGITLTVTGQ